MSDTTILPAPVLNLTPSPPTKWEREHQAFLRLLPELLKTSRGKYVAIHEGRVVESGEDPIALIKQAHECYGYVPIHVGLVVEQPPPLVRVPHYRVIGQQEPT